MYQIALIYFFHFIRTFLSSFFMKNEITFDLKREIHEESEKGVYLLETDWHNRQRNT